MLSSFVCVVLRPSQPNGVVSSVVNLPNHTFTGQASSSKQLTSIVHSVKMFSSAMHFLFGRPKIELD